VKRATNCSPYLEESVGSTKQRDMERAETRVRGGRRRHPRTQRYNAYKNQIGENITEKKRKGGKEKSQKRSLTQCGTRLWAKRR